MQQAEPDIFINSGDTIYADQPVLAEVKLDDGTLWKNVVTEAKSKAAQSVADFRGAYQYNLRGPAHAAVQQLHLADRAVGRSRGAGQLVSDARPLEGRTVFGSRAWRSSRSARGRRSSNTTRSRWMPTRAGGFTGRWVTARCGDVRARPAQLPWPEHARTGRPTLDRGVGAGGATPARVAQGAAAGVARDMEGDRQRHADWGAGPDDAPRTSTRSPTATTARPAAASWKSPAC